MGRTTVWSREQVASRILQGDTLIIFHGQLLNIPKSWLDAHPGGTLALLHFVGRDATDEIEACHLDQTAAFIPRYSIGTVELTDGFWAPLVPPIATGWVRKTSADGTLQWHKEAVELLSDDPSNKHTPASSILLTENFGAPVKDQGPNLASLQPLPSTLSLDEQARQSRAYRELHKRIMEAGLYKTRYIAGYGPEIARYTLLAALAGYFYRHDWLVPSAVFLGLFWHQLVFTAHDLGHMGVTHNWTADRIIATIIADYIGGLSIGWWVHVRSLALKFRIF